MRINHSGLDIFVAEEFLNCANIIASFEQVCGVTLLSNSAFWVARRTAFCTALGCKWWRLTTPDSGSVDRWVAGKTYCQTHSLPAWGYFLLKAKGKIVSPLPSFRSFWWISCVIFSWNWSGSISVSGSNVMRSCALFADRTIMQWLPKSISFTRNRVHSCNRITLP